MLLWALALGLITYREYKHAAADAVIPGLPRPWAYTASFAAYAFAALLAELNEPLGVTLAAAWTVAIFLGYFSGAGATTGTSGGANPIKSAA